MSDKTKTNGVEKKEKQNYKVVYLTEETAGRITENDIKVYSELTLQALKKQTKLVALLFFITVGMVMFVPFPFHVLRLRQGYEQLTSKKYKSVFNSLVTIASIPMLFVLGALANIGIVPKKIKLPRIAVPKVS